MGTTKETRAFKLHPSNIENTQHYVDVVSMSEVYLVELWSTVDNQFSFKDWSLKCDVFVEWMYCQRKHGKHPRNYERSDPAVWKRIFNWLK